jgi:hypothetical protein
MYSICTILHVPAATLHLSIFVSTTTGVKLVNIKGLLVNKILNKCHFEQYYTLSLSCNLYLMLNIHVALYWQALLYM